MERNRTFENTVSLYLQAGWWPKVVVIAFASQWRVCGSESQIMHSCVDFSPCSKSPGNNDNNNKKHGWKWVCKHVCLWQDKMLTVILKYFTVCTNDPNIRIPVIPINHIIDSLGNCWLHFQSSLRNIHWKLQPFL